MLSCQTDAELVNLRTLILYCHIGNQSLLKAACWLLFHGMEIQDFSATQNLCEINFVELTKSKIDHLFDNFLTHE